MAKVRRAPEGALASEWDQGSETRLKSICQSPTGGLNFPAGSQVRDSV